MDWLRLRWKFVLPVIGLVVLAFLVMDFNSRVADMRRLEAQKYEVIAEKERLEQQKSSLETQIAIATSDEAVIRWAYEYGHMRQPEDHPVVPLPPGEVTPFPTPTPVASQPTVSNWQMWVLLFVDKYSP